MRFRSKFRRVPGVLDRLGEEVIGIMAPVTICIAAVVALVRTLDPTGSQTSTSTAATIAYKERSTDSTKRKASGALVNALIFVAIITAFTVVLLILYKLKCFKVIRGYMALVMFDVFFLIVGLILIKLTHRFDWTWDLISLVLLLYNFAAIGVAGMLDFVPLPLTVRQGYTVVIGICVAWIFTRVPSWTAWVLLGVMALYDLYAVLHKRGPLRHLVEEALASHGLPPGLVYESRAVQSDSQAWTVRHGRRGGADGARNGGDVEAPAPGPGSDSAVSVRDVRGAPVAAVGASRLGHGQPRASHTGAEASAIGALRDDPRETRSQSGAGPVGESREPASAAASAPARSRPPVGASPANGVGASNGGASNGGAPGAPRAGEEEEEEGDSGLKLGLGDFIFYSMLVGRAAAFDMMTVYAAYLAVIAGLVATLMLLAISRKALPALPISIALGVIFYFSTRLVMEPVVVPMFRRLVIF